jgi:hypothetical protein
MTNRLAFDRASVRTIDQDGRLHVEVSNISKAAVNPYQGKEIPDSESLGLDPNKIYNLLRDPEELKKAAPTFNNIPLIDAYEQTGKEHIPVSARDPKKEIVVGSTGTDAVFEEPYLKNSLVVWDATAIEGIDSEERKEISCAYYYRADMTPGTYQGISYDGVMRDIRGNHVALVAAGRAGSDVVVGDSIPLEIQSMKKPLSRKAAQVKGAMLALKPKLAADAKLDLNPILAGITSANWKAKKPALLAAIKPKLAQDADLDDLVTLLDCLDNADDNVGLDDDPTDAPADAPAQDASPVDEIIEMLRGKISDDDLAAVEEKLRGLKLATDEDPEEKPEDKPADKPEDKPAQDNPPPTPGTPAPPATSAEKKDDAVDKPAMDAAIKAAVKTAEDAAIKRIRAIAEAETVVQPWVGKLVAQDSAESVYRAALETLGVDVSGIHPSAFRAVLQAQPKPDANRPRVAMDSAAVKGFADRYPQASKVRNLG